VRRTRKAITPVRAPPCVPRAGPPFFLGPRPPIRSTPARGPLPGPRRRRNSDTNYGRRTVPYGRDNIATEAPSYASDGLSFRKTSDVIKFVFSTYLLPVSFPSLTYTNRFSVGAHDSERFALSTRPYALRERKLVRALRAANRRRAKRKTETTKCRRVPPTANSFRTEKRTGLGDATYARRVRDIKLRRVFVYRSVPRGRRR